MSTNTKMEQLQEIIDGLPGIQDAESDRRKNALTKGDVLVIYKIAKIAIEPHVCPFGGEDAIVLQGVARNVTRTQKITSAVLITGIVGGILSGVWYTIVYMVKQFIQQGGTLH